MDEQSQGVSWLRVWVPWIIVAGVVVSYVTQSSRLQTSRPSNKQDSNIARNELPHTKPVSSVPWPLSGDPFSSAPSATSNQQVPNCFISQFAKLLDNTPANPPSQLQNNDSGVKPHATVAESRKIAVLPVLVKGGYDEDRVEQRRRIRYSVVSALGELGFQTTFPDRMTFTLVKFTPHLGRLGEAEPLDVLVPLKLYSQDELTESAHATVNNVLVIWILEEWLGTKPLTNLRALMRTMLGTHDRRTATLSPSDCRTCTREQSVVQSQTFTSQGHSRLSYFELTVLGPSGSDLWKRMVEEMEEFSKDNSHLFSDIVGCRDVEGDNSHHKLVRIIIPRATTPIHRVLSWRNSKANSETLLFNERRKTPEDIARYAHKCGIEVIRAIGTDDLLVRSLRDELTLRRAWPTKEDPLRHIVLVSEHDTLYGRAMPRLFREELSESMDGRDHAAQLVHELSYFKGIDGSGERVTFNQKDHTPVPIGANNRMPASNEEEREGPSQFDYLERLVARVQELKNRIRRESGGDVTAIGVVGSDIFDKLLVLRALRPHFRDSVFFTTDLDARLAATDELHHTRNMIVASHFALEFNERLPYKTLPFRDSYQSAFFFATTLALKAPRLKQDHIFHEFYHDPWAWRYTDNHNRALTPLVFEIGIGESCQLTRHAEMTEAGALIHPAGWQQDVRLWTHGFFFTLLFVGAAIGSVLFFVSSLARDRMRELFGVFAQTWRHTVRWASARLDSRSSGEGDTRNRGTRSSEDPASIQKPSFTTVTILVVWAMVLVFGLFTTLLWLEDSGNDGERWGWFSGISAWPSLLLELIVLLLAISAVGFDAIRWRKTTRRPTGDSDESTYGVDNTAQGINHTYSLARLSYNTRDWQTLEHGESLGRDTWEGRPPDEAVLLPADRALAGFASWASNPKRVITGVAIPSLGVCVLFFYSALYLTNYPAAPTRGVHSTLLADTYFWVLPIAFSALCLYTSYVLRRWRIGVALLRSALAQMKNRPSNESDESATNTFSFYGQAAEGSARFVADRTERAEKLIWWPFTAGGLIILSRLAGFDNWGYPIEWVLLMLFLYTVIIIGVWRLRKEAWRLRANALAVLELDAREVMIRNDADQSRDLNVIEQWKAAITKIKHGSLGPIASHPLVQAASIPTGGAALAILESLWFRLW